MLCTHIKECALLQILLVGPGDIDASSGTSRCMQMVQTAAEYKQSRLMFTPTLCGTTTFPILHEAIQGLSIPHDMRAPHITHVQ